MAKSKSFFGLRRGSTKSHTYQVLKGQQVTKDRVTDVANPRSFAQQMQRAKFAYLGKFYSKATKAFFKMAFEDKRATESDYNAFMRHNMSLCPYSTKQMADNVNTPWFGKFLMTKGGLTSLDSLLSITLSGNVELTYTYATEAVTVGMLSASILEDTQLIAGDIITIALINGAPSATPIENLAEAIENEALSFDNAVAPSWKFIQFRLNNDDDRQLTDLGFIIAPAGEGFRPAVNGNGSAVCGGVIVASRNVDGGLRVSDSHIIVNADLDNAINVGLSAEWGEHCAVTWGAQEQAILQGSLLSPVRETPGEQGIEAINVTLPVMIYDMSGTVVMKKSVTGDDVKAHLKFVYSGGKFSVVDHEGVLQIADGSNFFNELSVNDKTITINDYVGEGPQITAIAWE